MDDVHSPLLHHAAGFCAPARRGYAAELAEVRQEVRRFVTTTAGLLELADWLRQECAWAAARSKNNYLHAQFLRLRARRGPKKAILAVAASILTAAYYLLRDQVPYRDLGPHFARLDQKRTAQHLARRIKELGYEVDIRRAA